MKEHPTRKAAVLLTLLNKYPEILTVQEIKSGGHNRNQSLCEVTNCEVLEVLSGTSLAPRLYKTA